MGLSTHNALTGFQEANGLAVTGENDPPTQAALRAWQVIPATRVVIIPTDFAAGPFVTIPTRPDEQAKLATLGYQTLDEKLAERFHTTPAVLIALNPGGRPAGAPAGTTSAIPAGAIPASASHFAANQQIRVPNVGNDAIVPGAVKKPDWQATLVSLGVGSEQPQAAKVVVSKSGGTLKSYDASGKLMALFTATMGSSHDPLPLGPWKILGISHNPRFQYNPALFWDAKSGSDKATLPAGPNNPVGVVWIDISKPHYGIHGTPSPETIGRAESHGCVRLTNWDAARLAQMVSAGTELSFEA
jgi:lipoprotein-anchoring transpeptidase ErfK/SrfK